MCETIHGRYSGVWGIGAVMKKKLCHRHSESTQMWNMKMTKDRSKGLLPHFSLKLLVPT